MRDIELLKSKGRTEKITISRSDIKTIGEIIVQTRSIKQRILKTFVTAVICSCFLIVAAFIPILHFFLAPLVFVISIFLVIRTYRCKEVMLGGVGICPGCGAEFQLFQRPYKLPFSDVCSACNRESVINFASI